MDDISITTLIRARKHQRKLRFVNILCLILLITYATMEYFGVEVAYLKSVAIGLAIAVVVNNLDFKFSSPVTKADLITALEVQLSRDPEALRKLSEKNA